MAGRAYYHKGNGFSQILEEVIAEYPEREAIVFNDWRITYRDFGRYINQTAHMLRSYGLQKGDPVGLISRNCPEFLILEFAMYQIGVVPVKINWRLSLQEMMGQLDASHVKTAFLRPENPEWAKKMEGHYGSLLHLILLEGNSEESSSLLKYIRRYPSDRLSVPLSDSDTACHMHTSGTTGHAKTVVYTHGGMLDKISAVRDLYGYENGDRLQFIAQLFHSGAIGAWLCFCTAGTLILMSSFSAQKYMESLQRERVNAISVIPTVLKWILDELDQQEYDLSALRIIRYSTCPIPPALLDRALKKFHCRFYQSYGMTEMGSMVTILSPEDHLVDHMAHLSTVGRPIPGTELMITDETGAPCAPGTVGEILIKGPGAMREYYERPELTAEKTTDGWYHSGDMGFVDEKGYLTISGRMDDLIISGGENIYPSEIVNVLMQHAEISECCVFGVPDETWGEHVKASVVLTPGSRLTSEELIGYCRARIPHFKAPKEIDIVPSIPKNASGKILVHFLKEAALAPMAKH